MKAMILAAGRGERMRPLTDLCPKPLLKVAGIPLIEHHIIKLAAAGITDIVINHAWLGEQIEQYLGDGSQWQVNIIYSPETNGALETAGGIIKALPLLAAEEDDNEAFIVVNADVFTGFDFTELSILSEDCLAHLWLVENPVHNKKGDFSLVDRSNLPGLLSNTSTGCDHNKKTYTFSGIGLYRYSFFQQQLGGNDILPLTPLLKQAAGQGKITASVLSSSWTDVGTPQRLEQLNLGLQS